MCIKPTECLASVVATAGCLDGYSPLGRQALRWLRVLGQPIYYHCITIILIALTTIFKCIQIRFRYKKMIQQIDLWKYRWRPETVQRATVRDSEEKIPKRCRDSTAQNWLSVTENPMMACDPENSLNPTAWTVKEIPNPSQSVTDRVRRMTLWIAQISRWISRYRLYLTYLILDRIHHIYQ